MPFNIGSSSPIFVFSVFDLTKYLDLVTFPLGGTSTTQLSLLIKYFWIIPLRFLAHTQLFGWYSGTYGCLLEKLVIFFALYLG